MKARVIAYRSSLFNINGSGIHLKKSLMNLVSNAAEALPEGGLVRITTQNRTADRRLEEDIDVVEGDCVVLSRDVHYLFGNRVSC